MSCNGCRVLRKGCREDCMLRHCLMGIQSPQAQAHATLFVAKFFGRATLMSFLSSVPTNQTSALFQSLLYEAVGRTINPVNGAVGMLCTGNWHLCQLAVDQVLRGAGGALTPLPHHFSGDGDGDGEIKTTTEAAFEDYFSSNHQRVIMLKNNNNNNNDNNNNNNCEDGIIRGHHQAIKKQRAGTPNQESEATSLGSSSLQNYYCASQSQSERKLLTLFF